jgi:hypothetical protein
MMYKLLYTILAALVALLGYWLGNGFFGKKETENSQEVVSDCGCGGNCGHDFECDCDGDCRCGTEFTGQCFCDKNDDDNNAGA